MNAIIEAFFVCLLASMIWAPLVFIGAGHLTQKNNKAFADKLWPIALTVSALPAIFAPVAAMLGLSLRTSTPLPPMALPSASIAPSVSVETIAAHAPPLELSTIFETAAVLYFYGFLLFLTLGLIRMIWFSYRVHYAYDIVDEPKLLVGLEEWRRRIGVDCEPRYAYSDAVSSVCVHGFFRPVILMPMDLLDRVSLHDAILMGAHEMAHIKRGDTCLFALCTAVRAVFWFNPFMQRIAACANLAAEQAADALVITSGAERREYAQCFVQGLRFAASSSQRLSHDLVPSFTPFDKRSRRERLNAILSDTHRHSFLSMPQKVSLALTVMAAAILAFAQAAFAVAPKPAEEALPTVPLKGTVTMPFGERNKVLSDEVRTHTGIDIKAAKGTAIRAAGSGKVIAATNRYKGQSAWGNVVVIDHGHGLVTRYAHLDSFRVKKGESVGDGEIIGTVGSTGKSTGPHLHFEVIQDGIAINPAPVLAAKPMAAPAPLVTPTPNSMSTISAPTIIVPNLEIAPFAQANPEPIVKPSPESVSERFSYRLKGFNEKAAKIFNELDWDELKEFEGFQLEFSNGNDEHPVELRSFAYSTNEGHENWEWLPKEEKDAIVNAQKEARKAMNHARRESEKAMHRSERARERAERDAERAEKEMMREIERAENEQERSEREMELAESRAEHQRERAEYEFERAMQQAAERAEREMDIAEDELVRMAGELEQYDEQEMLEMQEKALLAAQAGLEKQLDEIKRQRKDLKRQKQKSNSD